MAFLGREPAHDSQERATRLKTPFVTWRLLMLAIVAVAVLGVFAARLYYLTVLRGPYYYELSENNFLFDRPVSSPRGNIILSGGETVALNRTIYNLEMSPFGMKKGDIAQTIDRLADLMGRPEIKAKAEEVVNKQPRWKSVKLAQNLDIAAVAPILERIYQLPGVLIDTQYDRDYPYGALLGHLTGYVGPISPEQLPGYLERDYLRADLVGKLGAERQFEDALRGAHGREILIRDARGRPRSSKIEEPAKRGNDVVLTIDLRLQRVCDFLMEGHLGAAIVMNPADGAILAMVSKPAYDPNFPKRIGLEGSSSYDKVLRGRFAPASTFKLITAAAGLGIGKTSDAHVYCGGNFRLPSFKRPFWCDVRWGHGSLDLIEALQKSCNVYFFNWANEIGRDKMLEAARSFGFGRPTGIDLAPPGRENVGIVGMKDVKKIFYGSVIQMGIGQGALIAVTPLQLVNAYAALANGGKLLRPHVFREERSAEGKLVRAYEPQVLGELPLTAGQRQILIEGFRRVVQVKGGTAFGVGFRGKWNVAGKTGSAEVHGQELTNGFFVGFAPFDDPKICVLVLIEAEGHGGATAAPIVREIMASYFDGKPPALIAQDSEALAAAHD